DILDRDHRLIGEAPEQSKLYVRERANCRPSHVDAPDTLTVLEHGHDGEAAVTESNCYVPAHRGAPGIGLSVSDAECLAGADGDGRKAFAIKRSRPRLEPALYHVLGHVGERVRNDVKCPSFHLGECGPRDPQEA